MKQLERSAELQERADRIKERENRRKANLKKKNERIEREREARARMGIPSPVEEDVGASQMRLGAFLAVGVGIKTKCEGSRTESMTLGKKMESEDSHTPMQRTTPLRYPLEPRSGNGITKPRSQTKSPESSKQPSATSSPCDSAQSMPKRIQITGKKSTNPSRPSPMVSNQHTPKTHSAGSMKTHTFTSMCPPPLPLTKPHKPPSVKPPSRPPMPPPIAPASRAQIRGHTKTPPNPILNPPRTTPMPPPPPPILTNKSPSRLPLQRPSKPNYSALPKSQPIIDEWAAFLVSNTQIERELSIPEPNADPRPHKPSITISRSLFLTQSEPAASPCPAPPSRVSKSNTKVAQNCTQDLMCGGKEAKANEQETEQDFGEDITDGDLEGAALEAELGAISKLDDQQQRTEYGEKTEKQTDSFCDDDFDFSTQELRDLVY